MLPEPSLEPSLLTLLFLRPYTGTDVRLSLAVVLLLTGLPGMSSGSSALVLYTNTSCHVFAYLSDAEVPSTRRVGLFLISFQCSLFHCVMTLTWVKTLHFDDCSI